MNYQDKNQHSAVALKKYSLTVFHFVFPITLLFSGLALITPNTMSIKLGKAAFEHVAQISIPITLCLLVFTLGISVIMGNRVSILNRINTKAGNYFAWVSVSFSAALIASCVGVLAPFLWEHGLASATDFFLKAMILGVGLVWGSHWLGIAHNVVMPEPFRKFRLVIGAGIFLTSTVVLSIFFFK